jgi:hypothetical protein
MKYLGFVLLVLSGYVMAEEVYYCSDSVDGVGYSQKENGNYDTAYFRPTKFKMKLQDDGNIAIARPDTKRGRDLYLCSTLDATAYKNPKSCVGEFLVDYFNFNQDNGRYILFNGFGYVFGDGDSVITSIGTCTKF